MRKFCQNKSAASAASSSRSLRRCAKPFSRTKHFPISRIAAKCCRVAFIDRSTRVGRSQGASIFWGLVSVCFAAAACFYYLKNHDNERAANQIRDQAMQLREENETLASQKDHLQASASEAATQLKTREDLVAEKESELAAEETRLEAINNQSQMASPANLTQVPMVKKFNDLIVKLSKDTPPDVVERGGRPVLRVPNAQLFALGDATLTPDGKALLGQIAQGVGDQIDTFELRVVCYSDTDAEGQAGGGRKDTDAKPTDAGAKPHFATSWDLTGARAAAIARYFRDQTQLPFLNVIVIGRGDSEPISSNTGDNHARNRRVEITFTPLPASFHAPEVAKAATPPVVPATKPKDNAKDSVKDGAKDTAKAASTTPAKKDKPKATAPAPTPAPTTPSGNRGH
jgi:flagellar motor protein MotB